MTAACLDDGTGRQLVCSPTEGSRTFSSQLGSQFVALAAGSAVGAASGAFFSPISHQLSVAFLAPFRAGGRLLGLVHLDISIANTRGSSLVINDTPGRRGRAGHLSERPAAAQQPDEPVEHERARIADDLERGPGGLGRRPQATFDGDHRAMAATLPLSIGATKQQVAVTATATAPNPSLFNDWNTGMLAVLVLAFLTLIGSVIGLIVSHRDLTRELSTDPLTRLRNRRALMEDLPRVCQTRQRGPNRRTCGSSTSTASSATTTPSATSPETRCWRASAGACATRSSPMASVYRLGGDEFCALITAPIDDPHALFQGARAALTEHGGGFTVSASAGAVELPREASVPTQALRLADQRMYRQKATSQTGAAELITSVLHAALAQRHPDLGEHSDDVAGDVELLARTIGLDNDAIDLVMKAGDLHDVGKLGIPDEIVTKPGTLTDQEWEFMRQHTVIGEQIIAAAGPSLERIGPLVRASHERWDGDRLSRRARRRA